jgi:hypothetical protein
MTDIDKGVPMPEEGKKSKSLSEAVAEAKAASGVTQERARENTHPTRSQQTWDDVDVHEESDRPWVRPTSLAAPDPRPGFKQRWIRVAMYGQEDATNASRRLREGWKPRPAETLPSNFPLPTISHGQWAGCIGIEGMILCEMPETLVDRRNSYYEDKTARITNSIEHDLQQQSTAAMPIEQERSSKVVREVKVAPDE